MLNELFLEFAAVIVMAGVVSILAHKLRQPLIMAYILTGVFVGPSVLGFTQSFEIFEAMSSVGIAFLLFIVGLNLNWRNVKDVGGVAVAAGFGQVIISAAAGFGLSQLLGFDLVTSGFLGISFAFSSTIIIVKLLTDNEDIDRLHGRIAVGVLLVQDLIAMMLLLLLAAYADGGSMTTVLTMSAIKGLAVIAVLWGFAKFIIPHLFLLFLVALSWCFAVASALQLLGFSLEIGALLAGISLSGTGFQHEIEAKVRSLRDFFLIIFFVVLGTQLVATDVVEMLVPIIIFSVLILIGNPIVLVTIMRLMGYHPRTGFLAGTTLAQVSEFSFILIGGGVALGLVDASLISLVTTVALITIACSSYMIANNERVYEWIAGYLPKLKRRTADEHDDEGPAPEVVLLGYDKMGKKILPQIEELTHNFAVLDFNPAVVEELEHDGVRAIYGDAGNEEVLKFIRADKAKLVISAIPDMAVNEDILDFLKHQKSKGTSIVTVKSSADAARCYAMGATFVIVPTELGGEHFAELLKKKKTIKLQWGSLGRKEQQQIEVAKY
jgi:Kef-type K+ transport system membrane component KefB/ribosomal protein L7Ae-like RNA K-turn-binding protein